MDRTAVSQVEHVMMSHRAGSYLLRRGWMADADYKDQEVWSYQNSPLNEALPRILSKQEAALALASRPPYDDSMRNARPEDRLHMVQSAMLEWHEPLPIDIDTEQRFSRVIRGSLPYRNPLAKRYYQRVGQQVEQLRVNTFAASRPRLQRSAAIGYTITGLSGAGKTSGIETITSLYPQWIVHTEYKGKPFHFNQLVWVHLDCPHDGSLRGLCLNFLHAVDSIFELRGDDSYTTLYGGLRATVDSLITAMATVAANHCLSVLIIDEIQHLAMAKANGAEQMLNFFVQLINTIGVPVVLVGTYKARAILDAEFRQIRRGSGQGEQEWDRMSESGVAWKVFLPAMWRYQFTKHYTELTPALSQVLYEETQGITDYAIKVFMMAQWRAITTGRERLSPGLLRSVAKDGLSSARKVLTALRLGRSKAVIKGLDDVFPPDISEYLDQCNDQLTSRESQASPAQLPKSDTTPPAIPDKHAAGRSSSSEETKAASATANREQPQVTEETLRERVTNGKQKGQGALDTLQEDGTVPPPLAFLEGGYAPYVP